MLVSSTDLLEGMLLVRTGCYIIQHFAVISRTRATPYIHNFGTTRECHGFMNPCRLVSQVVAGAGAGWAFVTPAQPVPMTRVPRFCQLVWLSHTRLFITTSNARPTFQKFKTHDGTCGGHRHNQRAGIHGVPTKFSLLFIYWLLQQCHDSRQPATSFPTMMTPTNGPPPRRSMPPWHGQFNPVLVSKGLLTPKFFLKP